MEQINQFLEKVTDATDISFSVHNNGNDSFVIEGEYWSDLGEDVLITLVVKDLTIDEIIHAMYEYEEDFDAEEHATEWFNMHGEFGAPTSLRALLEDADEQKQKLRQIYETMVQINKGGK